MSDTFAVKSYHGESMPCMLHPIASFEWENSITLSFEQWCSSGLWSGHQAQTLSRHLSLPESYWFGFFIISPAKSISKVGRRCRYSWSSSKGET